MKVLLDTNILLRISDPEHSHHNAAVDSVAKLRQGGDELRTVPQNLYEYWVVSTRPVLQNGLGLSIEDTSSRLDHMKRYFPLLRDERAILDVWQRLVTTHDVRGRNAHDTRLVAAMERHDITHLLTFNPGDFKRFLAITVLTPTDVLGQ